MFLFLLLLAAAGVCDAQVFRWTREQMFHYTPRNPFPRFEDGRPKVPEELLRKVKDLSVARVWQILEQKGYRYQFAGSGFRVLHPGQKLVGRAVTGQYLPVRPDLHEVIEADAKAAGMPKEANQKLIDLLVIHDVPVIDMMGAGAGHTFGGDNLHAAIWGATHTGAVIDGRIRDLEGIFELPSQVYYREAHPSAVANVSVAGINTPVKIGDAVCMPGDVVLGDRTGVVFIPPHLVNEVLAEWAK